MIHGGDVYRNDIEMDFSVNINPLGIAESVKEALSKAIEVCHQYPDIEAEELRKAIGDMLHILPEEILCGNGASELFQAIVHSVNPEKIIIPVPSFFGYEKAASTIPAEIQYYVMKKENGFVLNREFLNVLEADESKNSLLFLANPNNPIGNIQEKDFMGELLEITKRKGIYVVLDECFVDLTDDEGDNTFLEERNRYDNLVVVRAFTKSFAIPGVRIGFLICKNRKWRNSIKNQLLEWNTSCFAQYAGIAASKEQKFLNESVKYIAEEREFLINEMRKLGIDIYEGKANYLLIRSDKPLYEELIKRKVLIRDCSNFRGLQKGYYRIAVKKRAENIRLIEILKEIGV